MSREQALNQAIEANRDRLAAFVRRLVRDQAETEDVLQDVYEEFVVAYDLEASIERLGAWLLTVARNKVLDRFRRAKTRREYETAVVAGETPDGPDEWTRAWWRRELAAAVDFLREYSKEIYDGLE